jgi:hypothetical protein
MGMTIKDFLEIYDYKSGPIKVYLKLKDGSICPITSNIINDHCQLGKFYVNRAFLESRCISSEDQEKFEHIQDEIFLNGIYGLNIESTKVVLDNICDLKCDQCPIYYNEGYKTNEEAKDECTKAVVLIFVS